MTTSLDVPRGAVLGVFEALEARRATKSFDPRHAISDEELRVLLTAAALAPTAFNIQNRHVVAVLDAETKRRLQEAAFGQAQVAEAAVTFVLSGDLQAHRRTERFLRHAPAAAQAAMRPMIAGSYEGKPETQREESVRSSGMFAMALMLAATELGLDSCPMTGFDPDRVAQLLGLDAQHPPLMLVAVGRGVRAPHPRLGFLDLDEFVSVDRFGNAAIRGPIEIS
jgi:nitroreductase